MFLPSLRGGGAEGVCVNIANGLAEQGWQVDLIVLNLEDQVYSKRISNKVNLVELGVKHVRYSGIALLKYIHKNKPDIILAFNYELAVILVVLRSIFRFKTKIIARNVNTFSNLLNSGQNIWYKFIVKPLIKRLFCKVDHVINQCNAMREDLISIYPKLKNKSSVIYNPVARHIEEYADRAEFSKIKKRDYLLCVGRLEEQKAFHYSIEAFAGIANVFPTLRLKIVGEGSLKQELKQCANNLGVANRVDFEGFQKNMIPYYIHAKATVLTSLYEGFPNVLVESITLGTPVVAFDCPSGPYEIIKDDVNGYLVSYKDICDLELKLIKVLCDWDVRNINVKPSFKYERIVKQYADLIISL